MLPINTDRNFKFVKTKIVYSNALTVEVKRQDIALG